MKTTISDHNNITLLIFINIRSPSVLNVYPLIFKMEPQFPIFAMNANPTPHQ